MCKVTVSFLTFTKKYPDQESARKYLEAARWNNEPTCPRCASKHKQYPQNRKGDPGYYRCDCCGRIYTVRTGTAFEKSHIPLNKWLYAGYLMVTQRKGIASLQLSKEIGIGQHAAWFLLQRIREALGTGLTILKGLVEADEAYFGGKEENKHPSKKAKKGRGSVGKVAVLGMRERGGRFKGFVLENTTSDTIHRKLNETIDDSATLITDEYRSYLGNKFNHLTVNHSAKQFVDGMAHTNGIESVWAMLRRSFIGIHHWFSKKHIQGYVNECAFRLNEGNCKVHTYERIRSLVGKIFGKRITYKQVVGTA